jgi:stage II sporulation protein R
MKLKRWEISALAAIAAAFLLGAALSRAQDELSSKLIRLHVVANSDSKEDQVLKLRVRDAVLSILSPALSGEPSLDEARSLIADNMDAALDAARREIAQSGYSYGVSAELCEEEFPTRAYDTFTLPAGKYETLRVTIGEAEGRNWWCVIFPPLCQDPASLEDFRGRDGLSRTEINLIADADGTEIRFRLLELFASLRRVIGK